MHIFSVYIFYVCVTKVVLPSMLMLNVGFARWCHWNGC